MKISVCGTLNVKYPKKLKCSGHICCKRKCEHDKTENVSDKIENYDFLLAQYHVLSDRRIQHNELFWHIPVILLTAEAFLWIIALDSKVNDIACVLVATTAFIVAYTMLHALVRCRAMELVDAEQMYSIEKYFKAQGLHGLIIHHRLDYKTLYTPKGDEHNLFALSTLDLLIHKQRKAKASYLFLKAVFVLIIIISAFIIMLTLYECIKELCCK